MSHRARSSGIVALGIVALALFETGSAAAASISVAAVNFEFKPPSSTIHVGDTVVWTMSGDGHTVTSGTIDGSNVGHPSGGPLDSGFTAAGGSYSFTFTVAGTYPYFCEIHADSQMKGTITVVVATTPGPTPRATPLATPARTPPSTPAPSHTVIVAANPTSSGTPPLAAVSSATLASPPGQPAASPSPAGNGGAPASDPAPFVVAGILIAVAILGAILARVRMNG